ncbi:uncharacterized protein N7483_006322, partial [Penicillium malachiteum]|uniref:uncharacterized protein n=1 Tax=Penicillium malachiteum TaxID=1324776 RepID=UPI00254840EC
NHPPPQPPQPPQPPPQPPNTTPTTQHHPNTPTPPQHPNTPTPPQPPQSQDRQQRILRMLPAGSKLSIALGCWTSPFSQAFMAITGYFIDADWVYREGLLDFKPVYGAHTGQT